jgi:Skp family chaperone for outer membrane proteins
MTKPVLKWITRSTAIVLLVSFALVPAVAQEAPLKVAVVDVETVVAESAQGKALQTRLEQFQGEVQAELQRMQNDAQAIQQRITDGANSLSEDRLAELNKELEDATIAMRRYRDDKQREGTKIQEEGLMGIEQVLQPVFEQVRQEMGFDLILNNVPGVVLMISDRVDITPLMIQRLNTPASAAPPAQ